MSRNALSEAQPTETSPLLPQTEPDALPIDPGSCIAPGGASGGAEAVINDEQNERDLEQQANDSDTLKHIGLPEVRKRLKYIFPAIAIGVSIDFFAVVEITYIN